MGKNYSLTHNGAICDRRGWPISRRFLRETLNFWIDENMKKYRKLDGSMIGNPDIWLNLKTIKKTSMAIASNSLIKPKSKKEFDDMPVSQQAMVLINLLGLNPLQYSFPILKRDADHPKASEFKIVHFTPVSKITFERI